MKVLLVLLTAVLFMSSCTTSKQVQQMIDDTNQQIASQELRPEFERINAWMAGIDQQLQAMEGRVAATEITGARAAENIQNLSFALNKAQGDLGVFNEKFKELMVLAKAQQNSIDRASAAVDAQTGVLIDVFRKQLVDLEAVLKQLEGDIEGLEPAE